jgi:hypothetical protein
MSLLTVPPGHSIYLSYKHLVPVELKRLRYLVFNFSLAIHFREITTCWIDGGNWYISLPAKPAFANIRSSSGNV